MSLRKRQDKPTVRIVVRTVHEALARLVAVHACRELQLPCDLDLNR